MHDTICRQDIIDGVCQIYCGHPQSECMFGCEPGKEFGCPCYEAIHAIATMPLGPTEEEE